MPFAPTHRLALLVALVAPVWLLSGAEMGFLAAVVATALVVLLAAADLWRARARSARDVERRVPETVGLGERAAGEYRVASRWPRALDVEVHELPPRGLARTHPPPQLRVPAFGAGAAPLEL